MIEFVGLELSVIHRLATPTFTFLCSDHVDGDAVVVLNQHLADKIKWLKANKVEMKPNMTDVVLVGNSKVLKCIVLPTFHGVQLTLANLVKNLKVVLDPALLLEKYVNLAANKAFLHLNLA